MHRFLFQEEEPLNYETVDFTHAPSVFHLLSFSLVEAMMSQTSTMQLTGQIKYWNSLAFISTRKNQCQIVVSSHDPTSSLMQPLLCRTSYLHNSLWGIFEGISSDICGSYLLRYNSAGFVEALPSLRTGRQQHACGRIQGSDGRSV